MQCSTRFHRCCFVLLIGFAVLILGQARAFAQAVSATASPANAAVEGTETLAATVTPVYNHQGWGIVSSISYNGQVVASQTYTDLTLTGGVPFTETWKWQVPANSSVGTYTFTAQAYDEYGNPLNSAQTTFQVAASTQGSGGSPSASGTTIPPATQIVDASNNVWTVGTNGICYENGVQPGGCANVTELLYYQGNIYANTTAYGWFLFNGTSWAAIAGTPTTPSASGTTIPPAPQIVDASGNVWTVGTNGICYENGKQPGGCANVTELLYYQKNIYANTTAYGWFQFNGTSWAQIAGSPTATPAPTPTPTPGPVASGTCPQGTTYVSFGDGCQNAVAGSYVQHTNFFTGYTPFGTYPTRPPWNVAGVDYPVGSYGTASPPGAGNPLPSCVSGNGPTYTVTAPCTIQNFNFSVNTPATGTCFVVQGSGLVTFNNVIFQSGTSSWCSQYAGFIAMTQSASVIVQHSTFLSNYTCHCNGLITMSGSGTLMTQYNYYYHVDGRVVNVNAGATGGITNQYNYMEGMGNGNEHGEVVEINSNTGTWTYSELWNTYYLTPESQADTTFIYMQNGAPGGGVMGAANTNYNTLVGRNNGVNGGAIWYDWTYNISIGPIQITNNYVDCGQASCTGSNSSNIGFYFWLMINGTGPITGGYTCSGNFSLVTGIKSTGAMGNGISCS
ncbi:MAG TPA: hypothetical protein VEK34_15595 [Methylocella sp.]|nr:hypothetical protein [Methylocella sp.]